MGQVSPRSFLHGTAPSSGVPSQRNACGILLQELCPNCIWLGKDSNVGTHLGGPGQPTACLLHSRMAHPHQPHKREKMLSLPHLEVSVSSRGEGLSQQSQLSGPGTRLIKLASCIPWCTTVSEAFPRPPLEQGAALWPTGASVLTACGRQ